MHFSTTVNCNLGQDKIPDTFPPDSDALKPNLAVPEANPDTLEFKPDNPNGDP